MALNDLTPAKRQDLSHQRCGALGRLSNLVEVASDAEAASDLCTSEFHVAQDGRKDVVEVVRDAAGERAHGF